jgi:hypothetical protein
MDNFFLLSIGLFQPSLIFSRTFFHSHGQFFFLSIGLLSSIFIQNFFVIHTDNFFLLSIGLF